MAAVVDTDVVSFLFKKDTRATLYMPHLAGQLLVVSFMAAAELDRWALQSNWGATRQALMEEHLRGSAVHPVNRALCRK